MAPLVNAVGGTGANADADTKRGRTTVHMAAVNGHEACESLRNAKCGAVASHDSNVAWNGTGASASHQKIHVT